MCFCFPFCFLDHGEELKTQARLWGKKKTKKSPEEKFIFHCWEKTDMHIMSHLTDSLLLTN